MLLKNLYLYNFRCFDKAAINFDSGLNFIYGANASGKTTILEAISLLSVGKSFRTSKLKELISFGKSYFSITAEFEKEGIEYSLSLYFDGKSKKIEFNKTFLPSFSSLFGILPSVILAPQDLKLLDEPSYRRRFLNLLAAQRDPLYVRHLLRYMRAMHHRNSLLKQKSYESIEIFESEMERSTSYLVKKREEIIENLKNIVGLEKIDIFYKPSTSDGYKKEREKEMKLGFTLKGPHRDDFSLLLNGKESKLFASEGQKKSLIGSLRIAEWRALFSSLNEEPLFCIDDFESQLDEKRENFLLENSSQFKQVFITSPKKRDAQFCIDQGTIFKNLAPRG